jgi:drug/metabolite transporter (DMT)-like permease
MPPGYPPAEPPSITSAPVAAILFLLVAMSLVPLVDGIAKHLSAAYPVLLIVWGRYFFHLLGILPLALWRYGWAALRPRRMGLQLLRGGFLLGSTILFFWAISLMPLADALAIVFVYPFIVTAMSPVLLGEAVGIRRWIAVVVGFLGVLIIIRPGFGTLDWGAGLALAAGAVFALYILTTRHLAGSAPPLVTLAFTAVVGAVSMTAILPFLWTPLTPVATLLLILMGGLVATAHGCIIRAYELAPAATLAPISYTEIIGATLVGLVIFGDFPDAVTWFGILIVVASGVYVALRERAKTQQSGETPP